MNTVKWREAATHDHIGKSNIYFPAALILYQPWPMLLYLINVKFQKPPPDAYALWRDKETCVMSIHRS